VCGIAGIINLNGEPVEEPILDEMTDILAHRGPNNRGIYIHGTIGLGHRRLSIIDLSSAGRQPMTNEDGSLWLVFNGEIYNYQELVPELTARGHIFQSRTDSEVILHAYEEWGTDCLAFSLESRVPFLDYRLVNFLTCLPDDQKLRRALTKVVLRNSLQDKLPPSILNRIDKKGYPTPADEWFRTSAREQVADLLRSRSFADHGIFRPDSVRQVFDRFCRREVPLRDLWRWATVEVWMRTFFDQPKLRAKGLGEKWRSRDVVRQSGGGVTSYD
jgi:asparagine synthetase B (glutamine-hydrolysing)